MGVPLTLKDIQSGFLTAAAFNQNNTLIEQALAKALNRTSNATANAMEVDLDMGLNFISNLKDAEVGHQAINLSQLQRFIQESSSGLIARLRETRKIATAGQTVLNLADVTYTPGVNNIQVYINGVAQVAGVDYQETNSTTITFLSPLDAGDAVDVYTNETYTSTATADSIAYNTIDSVADALDKRAVYVGSLAGLSGLTPGPAGQQVSVSGSSPAMYEWTAGDFTAQIDGFEFVAWAGDTSPGATGAWVLFDRAVTKQYAAQYLQTTSDILNNVSVDVMRFIPKAMHTAIKDFTSTDNHAPYIQAANDALTQGGVILLPVGRLNLSATVNGSNRVSFKGQGRSSQIYANPDITQDTMFLFANGTSSMFSSRLDDCWLRVEGVAAVKQAIVADAWQENCGASGLVISGLDAADKRGILIRNGFGGAAYLKLKDIEIFGANLNVGIDVEQISAVGGFVLHVDGATIAGSTGAPVANAIRMANDTLIVSGFHTEFATNGIVFNGGSRGHILSSTGSANEVTNLVNLASTWTGDLRADMLIPNGATTTIKDNRSGDDRTGIVSGYNYSAMRSPSNAKAWASFNGTTGALKESYNVASVTRNSVGNYTILWDEDFQNTNYVVEATHNATNSRIALIRQLGKTTGSYNLGTQEWIGASASDAVYVDPTDVMVVAYANR